jgi:hypothetical protein
MIAMGQIGRKIRVGPVRGQQSYDASGLRYPVKLDHYRQRLAHVFHNVTSYYFVELVVVEWIRQVVQIVYYVRVRGWINVHSDCARRLVDPAADVENASFTGRRYD